MSAAKPERGRLRGTLGGRYNQTRRKEVQAGTDGGLGSQSGVDGMGPQELSAGSRWSTTCNLNTVIHYVGPMRAINMTPILSMGPPRTINGTPKVDNVRSPHSSNSLTASLPESSAQRNAGKTSTLRYTKGGNEKERSRLTKTTTREASMMLSSD